MPSNSDSDLQETVAAPTDDAPDAPPFDGGSVTPVDPVQDTSPISDPADEAQPNFNVRIHPDSGLEAPLAVTVPGLFTNLEPLPHPDDLKDPETGEVLPGNEDVETLVETADGWERPKSAPQPEPTVEGLDEYGRLELTSTNKEVPASVARVLEGLPYVEITAVTS